MHKLSNSAGSFSYGEVSWEDGVPSTPFVGILQHQNLIDKANTISLLHIFDYYNLNINEVYSSIVCPFLSHKGGRENTASFSYYSHTNSFFCFGCKIGGSFAHGCEFVAAMDNITKIQAAKKILKLFSDFVDEENEILNDQDMVERLNIMTGFSNLIRQSRQDGNEHTMIFLEKICEIYDDLNAKHDLDNKALARVIEQLTEQIELKCGK